MATATKRSPAKRATARRQPAAAAPALLGLTSDWYWEQDAELKFTRVHVRNDAATEQALARQILGKARWETGIEIEGGWEAHRAILEARAPFHDVLMWRNLPDGGRRYVSVSGEALFDAKGRFTGYRGIGRDITKQKRIQQLLKLDHLVTRRLADAIRPSQGLSGVLQAICETERWDCAQLWKPDEATGVLRRLAHWSVPGDADAERFVDESAELVFAPGKGLIGAAWQSGEPLWVADSTQHARALQRFSRCASPGRLPRCSSSPPAACASPTSACGRRWGRSERRSASSCSAPKPSRQCATAKRVFARSPTCRRTGIGSRTPSSASRASRDGRSRAGTTS